MKRPVRIIATLGPKSSNGVMIAYLSHAGMDVARINFSHGTYAQHKSQIDLIRRVALRRKIRIPILQDLQGYRIRIGELKSPHTLIRGQQLYLTTKPGDDKNHIPFDYEGDVRDIKKGLLIYLDDGKMALQVVGHQGNAIQVCVVHEGVLQSRKGVNIPGLKLKANIFTPKDKDDLEFGIQNNIEFIAQSFVRNKKDILNVMDVAKGRLKRTKYIAKIENEDGVRNLESIMDVCDGIMVARGDLGISLPIYKIAMIQKDIIQRCRRRNKFVITATQMLDSMTEYNRPTRAEVSDVTNAILDGTDFCMLSAETAAGAYPIQAVRMMRQIIDFTQKADHIDI